MTSGGGVYHSTPLLSQCRSIWLPRPAVAVVCGLGGVLLRTLAAETIGTGSAALKFAGSIGAWLLCWVALSAWKKLVTRFVPQAETGHDCHRECRPPTKPWAGFRRRTFGLISTKMNAPTERAHHWVWACQPLQWVGR